MSWSPTELLEPVDVSANLDRVHFSAAQVCAAVGISTAQLDYWTRKGDIVTLGNKQRLYDVDAIELMMLIKQGREKGLLLKTAIDAAYAYRATRSTDTTVA